ncbi:hypothetical protein EVAR_91007_1 [Eumeta japonica]|uniref:Uncharacterized protein n=1 Tax=Eumeta variegata TaxID=151549 RepID=A0A4C1SRL2_EUMVA|nr:hypothetical protein EVAR_91007_1 [Eumeta japonica]
MERRRNANDGDHIRPQRPTIYAQALQIVKTKYKGAAQLLANHGTIFNFYAIRDRLDKAYADTRPLYKENSRKHLATNNVISINKDINHNRGQNLGQDHLSIIFNLEHNSTNHKVQQSQPPEPMDTSSGNTAYRQPTSPNPFYHQPWKREEWELPK